MIPAANSFKNHFDASLKEYFAHRRAEATEVGPLIDSIEYSLFNGGKRFRPLLCYAVADALNLQPDQVTGFAMAVECVHTYSLIHDDLPCMDNDDIRRGQPTNHKRYSEDVALLAGDALLTEAFSIVASQYPQDGIKLIEALSKASGLAGMIRGQVLDLGRGDAIANLSDLIHLHELKTGQLIALCFEGPAIIAGVKRSSFRDLGKMIGLAFQVKDDLLDAEENDLASFITFLGADGTNQYLESLTEKIKISMKELSLQSRFLTELVEFNLDRNL